MKRIDRYLFVEVATPFLAAQVVFVVMFIGTEALTEATKLISRFGLPWLDVVQLLLMRIPWALGWTMPMSMGMAVILAIGRLCRDHEYIAMVVGGASFRRIMVPIFGFALIITGVALFIQEYLGPLNMRAYHQQKLELQSEASADLLEVHLRLTSFDNPRRITITAERLDAKTRTLDQVELNAYEQGDRVLMVDADRAEWQPEVRQWELYDGEVWDLRPRDPVRFEFEQTDIRQIAQMADFQGGIVFESSPDSVGIAATDKPDYLPYAEIRERIRWMEQQDYERREINRVRIYLARRWTLATSCLVFALVGAPLAVKPQRGASLGSAFALGMFLVLAYYITWNATGFLGEGSAHPWIWAWAVNIAGAVLGLFLFRRVAD